MLIFNATAIYIGNTYMFIVIQDISVYLSININVINFETVIMAKAWLWYDTALPGEQTAHSLLGNLKVKEILQNCIYCFTCPEEFCLQVM